VPFARADRDWLRQYSFWSTAQVGYVVFTKQGNCEKIHKICCKKKEKKKNEVTKAGLFSFL